MKVYKFGGASVKDAAGVRNLAKIVDAADGKLFVVVSAMGKMTNALEVVHQNFMSNRNQNALIAWADVIVYHLKLIDELYEDESERQLIKDKINAFSVQFKEIVDTVTIRDDFDQLYDRIVSFGELISTTIISDYLNCCGYANRWVDMRRILITDSCFREANVKMDLTAERLHELIDQSDVDIFIGQGFIGANLSGNTTTLGREGSDYSAAVVASSTDAESVTIWKDVNGIMNADPRYFTNTVHIPELSYLDAVELAYSGAQVIHPKTIKPLQNRNIPLYVRPFGNPQFAGSVIHAVVESPVAVPVLILKHNQVLITLRAHDLSFVLEDKFADIFAVFVKYRQKINMIQSSAVSLTVSVDNSRHLSRLIDELSDSYLVRYNEQMELLTIRGFDESLYQRYALEESVFLVQRTRRTLRVVRKEQ